jgi:hypothetical protein
MHTVTVNVASVAQTVIVRHYGVRLGAWGRLDLG